ncbi:MAG: hypothetical protein RL020_2055 [Pseudomonadota bacterium]|jgi:hypothetical protein
MFVFDILIPGTWLDYDDRDWAWNIQNQLESLKDQFFQANVALNLFNSVSSIQPAFSKAGDGLSDFLQRSEIQRVVEKEHEGFSSDEIEFETKVRFNREKWTSGRVPREFEHVLPFIYARTFVYALDAFGKFLEVLGKEANVPEKIVELHEQFVADFPYLRGVRNTAQHLEDRARGLGAGKAPKPLDLQPITNNIINAPDGGVLVLGNLNGSRYGSTMSDGHYGEIDVSLKSMRSLQKILLEVIQSFKWHGPKEHAPSG